MGIVVKQSVSNTLITYFGFAIGAANALFMYPVFLGETYYGLTAFLLSSANLLMPLMAVGVHHAIIRFYTEYQTEEEKAAFFSLMLWLPLLVAIPLGLLGFIGYDKIAAWLAKENPIVYHFVWQIPVIAICMGYFEVFYAWLKVHLRSVFGNFIKEVFIRVCISFLLLAVYKDILSPLSFIYATVLVYFFAALVMAFAAFQIKKPCIRPATIINLRSILVYAFVLILAGSVANLLLDIDKFMLAQYMHIEHIAYYSVAIFMATAIAVPGRAMHQITYPITARLMSENQLNELNNLYKKSSITLQIAAGYVLLGVLINLNMVYQLLPAPYQSGTFVVFAIGISKYFDMMLGNNNAIIFNSAYYKVVLLLGLFLGFLAIILNALLIPLFQINGAALATLIAIFFYSLAKLLFVVKRMNLYPFTYKNGLLMLLTLVLFGLFFTWDFSFHPLLNIVLKSALFTIVYAVVIYSFKISEDANLFLKKWFIFWR